jgi:hypothetical protein
LSENDERYQEWLERLEIPLEDLADIESMKTYLKDEFGIDGERQIEALWDTARLSVNYSDMGINTVIVTYPWGRELRYGVQGIPGLWGWESIQEIVSAEEGVW